MVDEAQDISAAAFELIRAAVPPGENDLFLVGDAHQRIYPHKVVLAHVGRGRSRSLKVNYRTTDEIRRWACAQLEDVEIDDLEGNTDTLQGDHSLTHGEVPEIKPSVSFEQDVEYILSVLDQAASENIEARRIFVMARFNEELAELADILQKKGRPYLRLEKVLNSFDKPYMGKGGSKCLKSLKKFAGLVCHQFARHCLAN